MDDIKAQPMQNSNSADRYASLTREQLVEIILEYRESVHVLRNQLGLSGIKLSACEQELAKYGIQLPY